MKPGSHGESSAKNKLDSLFFARLFVSEQKQIALIADENLRFSSYLHNKLLRNEDFMKNDMKLVRRAKRGDVDAFAEYMPEYIRICIDLHCTHSEIRAMRKMR